LKERIQNAPSFADIVFISARGCQGIDFIKEVNATRRSNRIKDHTELLRSLPHEFCNQAMEKHREQRIL